MPAGERRAEAVVALAFVVVAVPLAVLMPGAGNRSLLVVVLFVGLYAITSRVEFDVAAGYGVPTQLVLVPMLLTLPPGWVPLLVAVGFILGKLPCYLDGTRHPDRAVASIADSWHVVGPAVLLAAAHIGAPSWSDGPLLLAALGAQIAADLLSAVTREWLRLREVPRLSVRLLGSVYLTDLCLSPIGLAAAFLTASHPAAVLVTLPLIGLLVFFARDRRARMAGALELSAAYRGTALLLGDVVEADDAYTGSHSRDVVELSMEVGRRLGLDDEQLRKLEFAALLHDVGKIAVPNTIINKPGPLTDDERAVIETHTIAGETMLGGVGGLLSSVGKIVRSCHERYDGLGYPDRLAGDKIPVEARIVSCCDAFNAMTTHRPYRAAMPLGDALSELQAHRGTQFDPHVVDALFTMHSDRLLHSAAQAPPTQLPTPVSEQAHDDLTLTGTAGPRRLP